MKLYEFTKSYQLFEEAQKYVPNGIYGPRTPAFLTFGSYPAFIQRGEGCRIWDVDGNEYIDYMCSFGTNLLGTQTPEGGRSGKSTVGKSGLLHAAFRPVAASGKKNCGDHQRRRLVCLRQKRLRRDLLRDHAGPDIHRENGHTAGEGFLSWLSLLVPAPRAGSAGGMENPCSLF